MSNSSNQINCNWWLSDVATSFLSYAFIGGVWGAFTPYPLRNSSSISSIKYPLPPLSSLSSMGYYAGMFGSIAIVQRFTSGGLAVARGRHDICNEVLGTAAVYGYATALFKSEGRMAWNNRAVAGLVLGSVVYANTAPP